MKMSYSRMKKELGIFEIEENVIPYVQPTLDVISKEKGHHYVLWHDDTIVRLGRSSIEHPRRLVLECVLCEHRKDKKCELGLKCVPLWDFGGERRE